MNFYNRNWLRVGSRPIAATKPWEALGMSRRTWYRRQKGRGGYMTAEQQALLLTTARILRAHLKDSQHFSLAADDLADMDAVLKPFDPSDAAPVNEEKRT